MKKSCMVDVFGGPLDGGTVEDVGPIYLCPQANIKSIDKYIGAEETVPIVNTPVAVYNLNQKAHRYEYKGIELG